MTRFKILFLMVFLLNFSYSYGQLDLKGTIHDSIDNPVSSATVSLKSADGTIVSYTQSDQKGDFILTAAVNRQGMTLEVSSLGYKWQSLQVSDQQNFYNFKLEEASIDLPTITIKDKPVITEKGDTLSYRLSDFSSREDRVLGDVLKKIPGIEVADNGKISYNGKSISNFYIDGDNLLDDKYNIATKSISKDVVSQVQVIENEQPIKMLRNKIKSNEVALNITIKEEAKLKPIGRVILGTGVPDKYDMNANGMLFNKKYKGINYVKGNNIGLDPAQDLVSHNGSEFLNKTGINKPETFLSLGAASVPDLPQSRYLFNRAELVNVNNLMNLKTDVQLKTNFYYLTDRQTNFFDKRTNILLPDSTVNYTENQQNISRPDELYGQANLKMNKEKSFLNNAFVVDYTLVDAVAGLIANGNTLRQRLQHKTIDVSNEFSYMSTSRSGTIFSFYSYLNFFDRPESLMISQGIDHEGDYSSGITYRGITQTVRISSYAANDYFAFKRVASSLVQTYKLGFSLQSEKLKSELAVDQFKENSGSQFNDSMNNLNWRQGKTYAEGTYDFQSGDERMKATLTVPLSYRFIDYDDPSKPLERKLSRFLINPQVFIRYQTSVENFMTLTYTMANELGGIDDVYQGVILQNYRSLYSNNGSVPERRNNTVSTGFNYRKAITLFFFNVQLSYSRIDINTISSSIITSNLQQSGELPLKNEISTYKLDGSISKYLFDLKTTISAGLSITQNSSNQIQNSRLLPYRTVNREGKISLQSKVSDATTFGYFALLNRLSSGASLQNSPGFQFTQLRQQVHLSFSVSNNLYLNWALEHLLTIQSNRSNLAYVFPDFTTRYKVNKINTDFEVGLNNLANVNTYKTAFLESNVYTIGSYQIPGRMAVFRATFNF